MVRKMTADERTRRERRREMGLLVLGVVLGLLTGVISDLWASYYVNWLETTFPGGSWTIPLGVSTLGLFALISYLIWWSLRQIRGT